MHRSGSVHLAACQSRRTAASRRRPAFVSKVCEDHGIERRSRAAGCQRRRHVARIGTSASGRAGGGDGAGRGGLPRQRRAADADPPAGAQALAGDPRLARRLRARGRARRARTGRRLAPITIYRALDFLIAQGLAHRLASRNAYVACPHGHRPQDLVAFLICEDCGGVDERAGAGPVDAPCRSFVREARFEPHGKVLEISGRCAHCRPRYAPKRLDAPDAARFRSGARLKPDRTSLDDHRPPAPRRPRPAPRRATARKASRVGSVTVGGGAPIVVQSMTNTDTADVDGDGGAGRGPGPGRLRDRPHHRRPERGGSRRAAASASGSTASASTVPLVGDFHYIGHQLLADHPACAEALAKYRINPGNVGFKEKKDRQFGAIVEQAIRHGKAVRIGANWGSLDQELLTRLMDENARSETPLEARAITREAMVQSALLSAARAEEIGLPKDRIILSAKVSAVQDLIAVYRDLARRSTYAIHLGLTEAGMGSKGIVASSAAMGILLQEGIGDTIRFSLTPEPGGDRTIEVKAAQELLQTMGFRTFVPLVAACPGCGRTTSTVFQELAQRHPGLDLDLDAGVEAAVSRRRGSQRRGDGLHRERAGRVEARRHRHLAARHRRDPGRPGLHRRPQGRDPARPDDLAGLPGARQRLHRAALRLRRPERRRVARASRAAEPEAVAAF